MRKYLNGYDAPKFMIWNPAGSWITINFEVRYQRLIESVEEKYTTYDLPDGDVDKEFEYCNYFFELDYSDMLEADQYAGRIDILLHSLQKKWIVVLYPHKDQNRNMIVVNNKEDKYILDTHYGGVKNQLGNKGFILELRTKYSYKTPGSSLTWFPLNDSPITPEADVSQASFLQSEDGNYILNENGNLIVV